MILEKLTEDGLIKATYQSSNIIASVFDTLTQDLYIKFKGDKYYKYPNVKITDYTRFETDESQGKTFIKYIKPYPFQLLSQAEVGDLFVMIIEPDIVPEEVGENASELDKKQNDPKAMSTQALKDYINYMARMLEDDVTLNNNHFTTLAEVINAYKNSI